VPTFKISPKSDIALQSYDPKRLLSYQKYTIPASFTMDISWYVDTHSKYVKKMVCVGKSGVRIER